MDDPRRPPPGSSFLDTLTVVAMGLIVMLRSILSEHQFRLSQQSSSRASLGKGVEALKSALSHTDRMAAVTERASGARRF